MEPSGFVIEHYVFLSKLVIHNQY